MHKQSKIFLCVVIAVIVLVIGIPLVSALDSNGPPAITYNLHPCGQVATDAKGGTQLQLEADTLGLVNSRVCIHPILTNTGVSPIDLNDLTMNINIADIHGNSVYGTSCVVIKEPASLTHGQTWDCVAYWTPTLSGAYSLHVDITSISMKSTVLSASTSIMVT